jgi:hypothetical protein
LASIATKKKKKKKKIWPALTPAKIVHDPAAQQRSVCVPGLQNAKAIRLRGCFSSFFQQDAK